MDYKLELVLVPVSDVDRAKSFYTEKAGFNLDVDTSPTEEIRVVQVTPTGSACSIGFGTGITDAPPGSIKGLHLVVYDIEAARAELVARGVEVSEVRHMVSGEWTPGADPEHRDYYSFADFADPDGNVMILQEVRRGAAEA
jgi:catechol 2,3-dioxygenase-like lactoylglutathione lyase family enzyme